MNRIKNNFLLLFCTCFFLTLSSCDTEEFGMYEVDRIVGSWKLVEVYNENGQWTPAENIYQYTFNEDGTFISTRFSQCNAGYYSVEGDEISLDFDCSSNRMKGIERTSSIFIEEFNYDGINVIFVPTYSNCDQGCKLKFAAID